MSPLDRTGPDNCDLYHKVVEGPGFQPRQHRHLRAAFYLERAERIGLADHRIGRRILLLDFREIKIAVLVLADQIEGLGHAGQHSKRQDVHLHEFEGFDVVLVPLDDLAVLHRRRFDRHEIVEPIMSEDKTAGVLAEMARGAHQLLCELQSQHKTPVVWIEIELADIAIADLFRPGPHAG
nr:hypothetical protein K4M19_00403 [Agrobacterium fabrum]